MDVSTFDPLAPERSVDLWDRLAELRGCPIGRSDVHGPIWLLSRYEDVWAASRDWQTFSSADGAAMVPLQDFGAIRLLPIDADPPLQRQIRRLLDRFLTPKAVAAQADTIRAHCVRTLEPLQARGSCEWVGEFAAIFPATAFFDYGFGETAESAARVMSWVYTIMATPNEAAEAMIEFFAWADQLLIARREARGGGAYRGDVLDSLLDGEVDGRPLSDEELVFTIMLLFIGGIETTTHALSNIGHHLATRPDLWAQLQSDRGLIPSAIEEFLRYEAIAVGLGRTATCDATVDDATIPQGERVILYWASANRDPEIYDRPDELILDRVQERPHMTFGAGVHHCPGANFARIELGIVLEELLDRFTSITLDESALPAGRVEHTSGITRGVLALPLIMTRAG